MHTKTSIKKEKNSREKVITVGTTQTSQSVREKGKQESAISSSRLRQSKSNSTHLQTSFENEEGYSKGRIQEGSSGYTYRSQRIILALFHIFSLSSNSRKHQINLILKNTMQLISLCHPSSVSCCNWIYILPSTPCV